METAVYNLRTKRRHTREECPLGKASGSSNFRTGSDDELLHKEQRALLTFDKTKATKNRLGRNGDGGESRRSRKNEQTQEKKEGHPSRTIMKNHRMRFVEVEEEELDSSIGAQVAPGASVLTSTGETAPSVQSAQPQPVASFDGEYSVLDDKVRLERFNDYERTRHNLCAGYESGGSLKARLSRKLFKIPPCSRRNPTRWTFWRFASTTYRETHTRKILRDFAPLRKSCGLTRVAHWMISRMT